MGAVAKAFWWTKPDGSYGKVRASSTAEARKKKKGAKIHTKPPYSWMEDEPARRTSRTRKKAAPKKAPKKAPKRKTSRKAPPKKTSRGAARRKPPAKRKTSRKAPTKKKAPKKPSHPDLRSETIDEQRAIAETHRLLAKWKVPGYEVVFTNRQLRNKSLGQCNMRDRVITYSRRLWDRATNEQRREVVIHEVAHAVVRDDYGYHVAAHGKEWKAQMRKMGIKNPSESHTVPTHGISNRRDMVVVVCADCRAVDMTIRRLVKAGAKAQDGKSLWTGLECTGNCSGRLMFLSEGDKNKFKRLYDLEIEKIKKKALRKRLGLRPNTTTRIRVCGCH